MVPIGQGGIPLSTYNDKWRTQYVLRGVVERNEVKKSGWWIFEREIPTLSVRLDEPQRKLLDTQLLSDPRSVSEGLRNVLPSVLNYRCSKEILGQFPVGTRLGITILFASASNWSHASTLARAGVPQIKIGKLYTLSGDEVLENEFLASEADLLEHQLQQGSST